MIRLAQGLPSPTDTPLDLQVPVERPLADLVEEMTGSELLARIVAATIEPAARVLLIVVVAAVLVFLLNRLVDRLVRRLQEPVVDEALGVLRRSRFSEGRAPSPSRRRNQRSEAIGTLSRSIASVVIWVTALLMILGTFGISLAPLVASAGIVGIAIGFGAQDLVKDFLSGIFMLVEDQYGIGDIIDAGDAIGVVEGISLRSTEIRDLNGALWHIPNGEIRRVGNMSQEFSRVILDVAVAYDTDIDRAADVILAAAEEVSSTPPWDEVVMQPPEIWGVEELAESGIAIRLGIKITPGEQFQMSRELRGPIKQALEDAGISIPFPQRTVWIRPQPSADTDIPVEPQGSDAGPADAPTPRRTTSTGGEPRPRTPGPDEPDRR